MSTLTVVAWMVSDKGWNQCFTTLEQSARYGKKLLPLVLASAAEAREAQQNEMRRLLAAERDNALGRIAELERQLAEALKRVPHSIPVVEQIKGVL